MKSNPSPQTRGGSHINVLMHHNLHQTSNCPCFKASGKFRKEVVSFYSRTPRNLRFHQSLLISTSRAPAQSKEDFSSTVQPLNVANELVGFPLLAGRRDPSWEKRMMTHVSNFNQLFSMLLFLVVMLTARLIKGVEGS